MSIWEDSKRNHKKEEGNLYCDHNMVGDYNTGTVCYLDMGYNTVMYYKCSHVLNLVRGLVGVILGDRSVTMARSHGNIRTVIP